jgi:hypothetical protein
VSNSLSRMARYRMAETGEKYAQALRAIKDDPAERARLKEADRQMRERARYPFTSRDGLDSRHVLSAFETARGRH